MGSDCVIAVKIALAVSSRGFLRSNDTKDDRLKYFHLSWRVLQVIIAKEIKQ